ncbi:MAG: HigA family addiction module antidote protein [Acholeplasmataceae bacterium]|nr:HigA family addiction module antidote protein [Acholeplasmataceae bacterium]
MVQKLHHTSPDLLIHPGETIDEIIEDRHISQKELAIRTGFTEKHISTVVNGKKSISAKLALGLEKALGIPSSFWKNLQMNYDLEVEAFNEMNNISQEEMDIAKDIIGPVEVLTHQKMNGSSPSFAVWSLRRILGVSQLAAIEKLNSGFYRGQFNVDNNQFIMYTWQYLSEKECEGQTDQPLDIDHLQRRLIDLKKVMLIESNRHVETIREILNACGVLFTVNKHVRKAPINGLTVKTKSGKVMIAMTIRNKYVDTFWFSLFHEIAHVIHGDYLINQSNSETSASIEEAADAFAKKILINPKHYEDFIEKGDFTEEKIINFAKENQILPTIVVGRLMKDGLISWKQNKLREKYTWSHPAD